MSASHDQDRLPPRERFARPEDVLDLRAIAANLRLEPTPARDGHRQITLFHKPPLSLITFDFEAGGRLKDHRADAQVTIMAVDGVLEVSTASGVHRLAAGSLVVLDPGVVHDVHALEPSQMLLVVVASGGGRRDDN
jgi:quercetin dioxygenase-like cupin family protein